MAKILTAAAIDSAKPDKVRREIPDGKIAGLYLIVQTSGAKSFAVRYRLAGKPRKYTIGPYPAVDLATARKRAQEALGDVAKGDDPAAKKQAAKAAARAEIHPANDRIEKVVADFVERYAKPNQRDWKETKRLLEKDVVPAWNGRRLSEIGRADVHRVLDRINDRDAPGSARNTFSALRKMCRWAVSRGIVERSPCDGIEAPSANAARARVLADDELCLAWKGADQLGFPFGPLTRLLILTGARRAEVAGMTWAEVDLLKQTWTIPAPRAKNGREHTIPLSSQAVAILQSLPRFDRKKGEVDFVFSPGQTPPSGFSRAKSRLDAAILKLLCEHVPKAKAPPTWVIHDLRRSVASGMARLGVQLPVIERCLNHVSGSFGGIVGVYQRHSFADEMRAALDAWGRHVEAEVSGKPAGNVVELRAGA